MTNKTDKNKERVTVARLAWRRKGRKSGGRRRREGSEREGEGEEEEEEGEGEPEKVGGSWRGDHFGY
jgi:hypothetical protein